MENYEDFGIYKEEVYENNKNDSVEVVWQI